MNIISVYQTVYTVLLVLAGVFFVMAVVVFFVFDIRSVMNSLSGRNTKGLRAAKSRGKKKKSSAVNTAPKPSVYSGQDLAAGEATVMTRFLETMMIDPEEDTPPPAPAVKAPAAPQPVRAEIPFDESVTEALDENAREVDMTIDSLKAKLGFRPDVKILVYSAGDRI